MASEKSIIRGLFLIGNTIDFVIVPPTNDGMPGTVETWAAALGDLTDEQVDAAFVHFIRTLTSGYNSKPRPGDVRAFVSQVETGGWSAGWAEYLSRGNSCSGKGSKNNRPWASSVALEASQRCGGTLAIRECPAKDLPMIQAQFKRHFEEIVAQRAIQDTLKATGQAPAGQALPEPGVIQISEARARQLEAPSLEDFSSLPPFDAASEAARVRASRSSVRDKFRERGFGNV